MQTFQSHCVGYPNCHQDGTSSPTFQKSLEWPVAQMKTLAKVDAKTMKDGTFSVMNGGSSPREETETLTLTSVLLGLSSSLLLLHLDASCVSSRFSSHRCKLKMSCNCRLLELRKNLYTRTQPNAQCIRDQGVVSDRPPHSTSSHPETGLEQNSKGYTRESAVFIF